MESRSSFEGIVLKLGDGYDSFSSKQFQKISAIEVEEKSEESSAQQYGYKLECIEISTSENLSRDVSLHLAATLEPVGVPVGAELSTKITKSNNIEEYYLHYLVTAYAIEKIQRVVPKDKREVPALKNESKKYITTKGDSVDLDRFYRFHGNSYISEVKMGRRLYAVVTVKRKKNQIKEDIQNEGKVDLTDASGAKASLHTGLEKFKNEVVTNIQGGVIGYKGAAISTSNIDDLKKAINDFFNISANAELVPVSYASRSYEMILSQNFDSKIADAFRMQFQKAKNLMQGLSELLVEISYYSGALGGLIKKDSHESYKENIKHYQEQQKAASYFKYVYDMLDHYIQNVSQYAFKQDQDILAKVIAARSDIEKWMHGIRASKSFGKLIEQKVINRISGFGKPHQEVKFNEEDFPTDKNQRYLFFSATPKPGTFTNWEQKEVTENPLKLPVINVDESAKLIAPSNMPDFSCNWLGWRKDLSFELRKKKKYLPDSTKFKSEEESEKVHEIPPLVLSGRVLAYIYYNVPENFDFKATYYISSANLSPLFYLDIFSVKPSNLTKYIADIERNKQNKVVIEQGDASGNDSTLEEFDPTMVEGLELDSSSGADDVQLSPILLVKAEEEACNEEEATVNKIKSLSPRTMSRFFNSSTSTKDEKKDNDERENLSLGHK